MHDVELGLEVVGDRGGVKPHHLAEVLGVGVGKGLLSSVTSAVDGWQQHGIDASIYSTFYGLVSVVVKRLVVEVAVGVNHFFSCWRSSVKLSYKANACGSLVNSLRWALRVFSSPRTAGPVSW